MQGYIRALFGCGIGCLLAASVGAQTWIDTLDAETRASILWKADHEGGNLYEWHYSHAWPAENPNAGGGVFNTGGADAIARAANEFKHSGNFSAEAAIRGAFHEVTRAVRLLRWTDKPWDEGGGYFPNEAYYSAWFYFPRVYNPNQYPPWDSNGDGGWWNVFQFKSDDNDGNSQPVWVLNVGHRDDTGKMFLYLHSGYNTPSSYASARELPAERWVHLEAYYENRTDMTGKIIVWQDGAEILNVSNVKTGLGGGDGNVIWGIGNYSDHIVGGPEDGTATIYFDDAVVSTRPTHTAVPEPSVAGLLLILGAPAMLLVGRRSRR